MICKNLTTKEEFNYSFIPEGMVKLENPVKTIEVKYEDWCQDYLITDKWNNLKCN